MKGFGFRLRTLLLPFSFLYGFVILVRNLLFDTNLLPSTGFRIPVISVGNITAGGTGKTPHIEWLIRQLKNDYRLAVLSRGYKRKTRGFLLVSRHSLVSETGDEALQIKTKFPEIKVAVDSQRVRGVKKLLKIKGKPEVILLDDAFQHRYIRPGLSVLLVDYNRPVFHDHLLPSGNLREPWNNSKRANFIIVTKCPAGLLPVERMLFASNLRLHPKQDLYFTTYSYASPQPVFRLKKKRTSSVTFKQLRKSNAGILLVTGIADPRPVLRFLKGIVHVHDTLFFPDHHQFSAGDLQLISRHYYSIPATEKFILVTEKDAIRLQEMEIDRNMREAFLYIPVEVKFLAKGEKPFYKRIEKYIRKTSKE